MTTLHLSASITIPVPDGAATEFALLVIPEDGWDLDLPPEEPGSVSSPADRAILAAEAEGWHSVGNDDNFAPELEVSVITFWRKVDRA